MDMVHLLSLYRGMNTGHLTVDELEHELKIRDIPFDSSRSGAERALRNRLKEERELKHVEYELMNGSVLDELETCELKVSEIKSHLENRKSKQAPEQSFKTRILHCVFRLERLRTYTTKDDELNSLAETARACMKLLNTFFSISSHLPEVREAELALINQSLTEIMKKQDTEKGNGKGAEEDNESWNSTEENNGEEIAGIVGETGSVSGNGKGNGSGVGSGVGSGDGKSVGKPGDVERAEFEQWKEQKVELINVVNKLLEHIQVLEAKQAEKEVEKEKPEVQAKPANSTQLGVDANKDKKDEGKSQQNPGDFLAWLNQRNSSLGSFGNSENEHNKPEEVHSGKDEPKEKKTGFGRSLPVHKWTVRYDGMDNGRKLNEFLKEVEFNARSENISESELFQCAHHLFTRKARSWFMEVNGNNELGSWKKLVDELKSEFLPIDIDYVYERQANNRKQMSREKFQDYYLDMVRIFRCMTNPWDEKRKFDVLFRNTREDCQIAMLAADIKTIPAMKEFGKRFDSVNWKLYQKGERYTPRSAHVEEVQTQRSSYQNTGNRYQNSNRFQGGNRSQGGYQQQNQNQQNRPYYNKNNSNGNYNQKSSWKPEQQRQQSNGNQKENKPRVDERSQPKPNTQNRENSTAAGSSGTSALQRIVKAYIPVKRDICYNCHVAGHGHEECRQERSVFCVRCGFPGFSTKDCPYCEAKNMQKTAQ